MAQKKLHLNRSSGEHFHFDNSFWHSPLPCGFIRLYQMGELCCAPGFKIEEHEQDVYEITYVISGAGFAFVDGERISLGTGDLMINSVGHTHAIEADKTSIFRFAYMGFCFSEDDEGEDIKGLRSFFDDSAYYVGHSVNNILYPFVKCVDEFYTQLTCCNKMIRSYCKQIVILAARNFMGERGGSPDRSVRQGSVNSAVYTVIRYVEENIDHIDSIREIAEKLGYNYTYLSHFFKDKTGTTLRKYISYKKIERAAQLLSTGAIAPSQIWSMLDYESHSSFSKAFRRVMGVTPKEYMLNQGRRNGGGDT